LPRVLQEAVPPEQSYVARYTSNRQRATALDVVAGASAKPCSCCKPRRGRRRPVDLDAHRVRRELRERLHDHEETPQSCPV